LIWLKERLRQGKQLQIDFGERLVEIGGSKVRTYLFVATLGYLPFEPNAAHLFFQLVSRRYERGAILRHRDP
jgi:DNA replication protein DnaC